MKKEVFLDFKGRYLPEVWKPHKIQLSQKRLPGSQGDHPADSSLNRIWNWRMALVCHAEISERLEPTGEELAFFCAAANSGLGQSGRRWRWRSTHASG